MESSRYRVLVTWILFTVVAASACQPSGRARRSTVIFASGADLQSINPLVTVHPLAKQVQKHVLFLTLARYDTLYVPRPLLASWIWNDRRTELTFSIRPDVSWTDGTPTTARDVAWTLRMARLPEVAYPRRRDLAAVRSITVRDSLTLVVRFRGPQPVFPDVLTDLAILPEHLWREVDPTLVRTAAFNRDPVGNGPFAFVEYLPNQRWVFEAREEFPHDLGRPGFERFVVVVVDESATKLAALTSGELDFAGINPAHAVFVREDERLRVLDYPVLFSYALVWNLRRQPFDQVEVRRALTAALDRELLVNAYVYGFGEVADGPVSPDHPWHLPVSSIAHDPQRARSSLRELGWLEGPEGVLAQDGRPFNLELTTVGGAGGALEQLIQGQLEQIGIAVTIRQLELSTFLSVAQSPERDFDALVLGVPGDLSLGQVIAMYSGSPEGPLAYPGYRSAEFEEALTEVEEATSEAELAQAWREVQLRLARDHPTTWLYHARGVQGINNRIRRVRIDLRGELAGLTGWNVQGRTVP